MCCSRHLTAVCALAILLASAVAAQAPIHSPPPGNISGDAIDWGAIPTQFDQSKPCVLLHNDNVLFGTAVQEGDYVVIRKGPGNQIRLPRRQVACWADSLRDLHQYRVDHRRTASLDELVEDAKWCTRYELFDLAYDQLELVLAIHPKHKEATRLHERINRLIAPTFDKPTSDPQTIRPVGHTEPTGVQAQTDEIQEPNVSPLALQTFAADVQPTLINRCARCHDQLAKEDVRWSLIVPTNGTRASGRMTKQNLLATLRFVEPGNVEQSEFYIKATTAHGGEKAPLDARHEKAIFTLRRWLLAFGSIDTSSPKTPTALHSDDEPTNDHTGNETADIENPWDQQRRSTNTPSRLPRVANPFDPELFHRKVGMR